MVDETRQIAGEPAQFGGFSDCEILYCLVTRQIDSMLYFGKLIYI